MAACTSTVSRALQMVGRRTLALIDDLDGRIQVGGLVHVGMADAGAGLDDRHGGVLHHELDEPGAAAGDDDVDLLVEVEHLAHHGAIRRVHEADGALRHAGLSAGRQHGLHQGGVGAQGLAAAAQDGGVAGLEAEGGHVHRDVGARLVDDANHAQGRPALAHLHAVGTRLHLEGLAHGVWQGDEGMKTLDDAVQARRRQGQAIQHGRGHAAGASGLHVLAIGLQEGFPPCDDLLAMAARAAFLVATEMVVSCRAACLAARAMVRRSLIRSPFLQSRRADCPYSLGSRPSTRLFRWISSSPYS